VCFFSFVFMIQRVQRCTLFPYTTLFRSMGLLGRVAVKNPLISKKNQRARIKFAEDHLGWTIENYTLLCDQSKFKILGSDGRQYRSEEHTSELQSRFDLVCRLLLEKKNTR